MTQSAHTKVLIIGSGAAGYTAAIYAARANLAPTLIRGLQPGGQLTITTDVENYPGFAEPIQGPWLMEQMYLQTKNVGTEICDDIVISVDLNSRPFSAIGDSGQVYTADTIIVCTGASARWLGLESESKYMGFGVSACATCDGFFFRDKPVAVIGGGNTAVEEALFLTNFASKVTLIHRRDTLRADKILQDRLFKNNKIEVRWNSILDQIVGTDDPLSVTGIVTKGVKSGELHELSVDGVFIAIGHNPNTELFSGQLEMDEQNYLITNPGGTTTNIPGVFAAGDVQDTIYRQAVTAAGTGCMAALEAESYLASADSQKKAAE